MRKVINMAEEIKIWSIQQGNKLRELQKSRLDLEERIEDWEEALSLLPEQRAIWKYYEGADSDYSGFDGYFNDTAEVQKFLNGLGALPQR